MVFEAQKVSLEKTHFLLTESHDGVVALQEDYLAGAKNAVKAVAASSYSPQVLKELKAEARRRNLTLEEVMGDDLKAVIS